MAEKELDRHIYTFNGAINDEVKLTLTTIFHDHNGKTFYTSQMLTLKSYSNSAHFELVGTQFTPKNLRKLADELEVLLVKYDNIFPL